MFMQRTIFRELCGMELGLTSILSVLSLLLHPVDIHVRFDREGDGQSRDSRVAVTLVRLFTLGTVIGTSMWCPWHLNQRGGSVCQSHTAA